GNENVVRRNVAMNEAGGMDRGKCLCQCDSESSDPHQVAGEVAAPRLERHSTDVIQAQVKWMLPVMDVIHSPHARMADSLESIEFDAALVESLLRVAKSLQHVLDILVRISCKVDNGILALAERFDDLIATVQNLANARQGSSRQPWSLEP